MKEAPPAAPAWAKAAAPPPASPAKRATAPTQIPANAAAPIAPPITATSDASFPEGGGGGIQMFARPHVPLTQATMVQLLVVKLHGFNTL